MMPVPPSAAPLRAPQPVQPTAAPLQTGAVPTVATTKDGNFWKQQIAAAISRRQKYEPWWEACLKAYAPFADKDLLSEHYGTNVRTNRTFTLVERKRADLFYRRPDLSFQPTPLDDQPIPNYTLPAPPPAPGQPPAPPQTVPRTVAIEAHETITNYYLGDHGIDATGLMDAVSFDLVCHQGFSGTKMGYESSTIDQPDPRDPTGQSTIPVPIASRCYWEHFSGKQVIIPANFRATDFEKAPFLGVAFELPLTDTNRQTYHLPPDYQGTKPNPQFHYDHGDPDVAAQAVFTGFEIYYRSVLFRTDRAHPDHLTQLILVDGVDDPVIERDCPYQRLTPTGELTPDSLIGFPIHLFCTRTLADSAYVASDGTMIRPLETELDVFRTQMVQFRDATTLRYICNADVLPADALTKIVRSPIGGIVPVPAEAFMGDGAIKPLESGTMPRESFQTNDYLDNDLARTTGIDSNGEGVASMQGATATRDQIVASNASARLDKERSTLLKQYVQGATKFATLLQQYVTLPDATRILGPQTAAAWDAWRTTADTRVAFTAMPDSALRVDAAVDRRQAQDLYSFLANDPYIQAGRQKLLEKLLRKFHIDPAGIVAPPPPAKPKPPDLSFSFSGQDLVGPQAPIVLGIAQQLGITIDPSWVTLSQSMEQQSVQLALQAKAADVAPTPNTQHGGKLAPAESLDKHHADSTGALQGIGGPPAPMGAPGGHLQ